MLASGTVHQGDEVGEEGLLFVGGGSGVRAGLEGSMAVVVTDVAVQGTVRAVGLIDVAGTGVVAGGTIDEGGDVLLLLLLLLFVVFCN